MKKIMVLILLSVLLLSACGQTVDNHSDATQHDITCGGFPPPPQPIHFDSLEDTISFIKSPDMSIYYEEYHEAYQYMIEVFREDGYVTIVANTEANRDSAVILYPEAKYEDLGICFWFEYNENMYQVLVYNTYYTMDKQNDDIFDYYRARGWGQNTQKTIEIFTNNEMLPSLFLTIEGEGGAIRAKALLNDLHYVVVRAIDKVSKTEFVRFIEGLEFEEREL
ncbi:MAG: hypothetical protein E7385_03555 [Ruminococcaceae bacterium]|nr:hypothetical protein [Oscillospiraceae bacterium]